MDAFHTVLPENFDFSTFHLVSKDWMLITAESGGRLSSMTASWGGMGVMWGKNVAWVVIRESRFTKTLIDGSETFSLTFFDHAKYEKMLSYMGKASGRNEDKIAKSGLTVEHRGGIPYFAEAKVVFLCRKMCCQPLRPDSFTLPWIDPKWYEGENYHTLYLGAVEELLVSGAEAEK